MERVMIDKISKKFKKGVKEKRTISKINSFFSGRQAYEYFWVLKNISFNIKSGENIGIIGANGSGKTTLLRIIAGIFKTNRGKVVVNGRLVCLSNLSNGLKPRLTVRDNIFLVGTILGLTHKEIKRKFNEIIEFADLQDFVYSEFYQLSSGMKHRISFSITIHCVKHSDPDILLLDEVFSGGGDEDFKNKSLKKIEELIKSGTSVVIVSHKLPIIQEYCDRVIWLDKGEIKKVGEPKEVIKAYLDSVK